MDSPQAGAALLLLAALAAAVGLVAAEPGPGPLALCTTIAAAHAALVPHGGALSLVLALPALCAVSYGRAGAWPLLGSLALVGLAAAAGHAGRHLKSRLYLPSMLLVFVAPFALHYLVIEFGDVARAEFWRHFSPAAAADRVAEGRSLPAACALLLLAWPVWAVARRGR